MRVSLRWLAEFIDLPTDDPAAIEQLLAGLGHEVEGVERLDIPFTGVVIARVEAIRPHPDADKIRLVTVDRGTGSQEVVCGAWNFDEGAVVPLATVGAVLPGNFEIGAREIRGVVSEGMICSERELGFGGDHEGILVLEGDYEPGRDFTDYLELPDVVFDLSITPNRPDAMSMLGIARDLGAKLGIEVREPEISVTGTEPATALQITVEDPTGCPRFVGREVRGVTSGASPMWLQARLRAAGVRPISNLVDATNYTMLELGHPTHVFDLDQVAGEQLIIHRAGSGDTLQTLDDIDRTLDPGDIVISDADGIISLAGIMGGGPTEVSATTSRVLVEAAHWHPPAIMYSSKRHNLRSEASARFERGVDPNLSDRAAARVAQLLVDHAGGEAAAGVVDVYPEPIEPWPVELPLALVERIMGVEISSSEAADFLTRLGLDVTGTDPLRAVVPTYRPDLTRPIDLVEEIARLYGYDNVPERLPLGTGGGLTPGQKRLRLTRSVLTGAGLTEANTLGFMGEADLDTLGLPDRDERRATVRVKNPLSETEETLRSTLLPGLIGAAQRNVSYGHPTAAFFEIGRVFRHEPSPIDKRVPHQPLHLGALLTGPVADELGGPVRPYDVHDATALVRALSHRLGWDDVAIRQRELDGLHPGRAAEVVLAGESIGAIGELHPAAARRFGLSDRVAVLEIGLESLLVEPEWWTLAEPSVYPPHKFDLAFEMSADVPAGDLLQVVRSELGSELDTAEVFDEFDLGGNRKSLAVTIVIRAHDHTLTDEEAQERRLRTIEAVETSLDVKLRGA
ncbi:MAG: phenylalanine--tRNA ligase subunit beta [Acidimicrobiia bacterium]|nr:phenylalanine--tRNA ligase subunit beta [Acidimicrobiia bacterium]NNL70415.1 phenylalanine--tRNA ligase subunit beta [Acidimicrobiia bacterium]